MADKRVSAAAVRRVWMDTSLTTTEAAEKVGLKRVALQRRAKALGLPARKFGQLFRVQDVDLFRGLWTEGVPVREIGRHFGISCSAVWYQVRHLGLPRRKVGVWQRNTEWVDDLQLVQRESPEEFKELWLARVSKAEMARHFGMSIDALDRRRKALDLPARGTGGRPITLTMFWEMKLAETMAQDAKQIKAQLHLAEMVDQIHGHRRAA